MSGFPFGFSFTLIPCTEQLDDWMGGYTALTMMQHWIRGIVGLAYCNVRKMYPHVVLGRDATFGAGRRGRGISDFVHRDWYFKQPDEGGEHVPIYDQMMGCLLAMAANELGLPDPRFRGLPAGLWHVRTDCCSIWPPMVQADVLTPLGEIGIGLQVADNLCRGDRDEGGCLAPLGDDVHQLSHASAAHHEGDDDGWVHKVHGHLFVREGHGVLD